MVKNICFVAGGKLKNNMRSVLFSMANLLKDHVRLHLVVGRGEDVDVLGQYYIVHRSASPSFDPGGIFSAFAAASIAARKTGADIILNVSHPFPLGAAVVFWGWVSGIPTLLRFTGDPFSERKLYANSLLRLRKKIIHEWIFGKLIYSNADLILPVGQNLARVLEGIGVSRDKIVIRPQPFDVRPFCPTDAAERTSAKQMLRLNPLKKTVLFVGSLTWGKGVDRLANIIRLVESKSDGYQFCIVGKGPASCYLTSLRSSNVFLAGNISRDKVVGYFRAADVLIHPTRRDALPNVVLEAIAAGVPVVASPVGEISYYVTNIARSNEEFADMILDERFVVDVLPAEMDWKVQRDSYLGLFEYAFVRRINSAEKKI